MSVKHRMGVWKIRPFMDEDGEILWRALRRHWLFTWWHLHNPHVFPMMDNRMVFGSADVAKWYIQQRIWKHAHELVPTLCAQRKLRRWRAADSSLPDTIRFP